MSSYGFNSRTIKYHLQLTLKVTVMTLQLTVYLSRCDCAPIVQCVRASGHLDHRQTGRTHLDLLTTNGEWQWAKPCDVLSVVTCACTCTATGAQVHVHVTCVCSMCACTCKGAGPERTKPAVFFLSWSAGCERTLVEPGMQLKSQGDNTTPSTSRRELYARRRLVPCASSRASSRS